jgi:hypothetical protein
MNVVVWHGKRKNGHLGHDVIGPFETADLALRWIDRQADPRPYLLKRLLSPNEEHQP